MTAQPAAGTGALLDRPRGRDPLLAVTGLTTSFPDGDGGRVQALDDVSFTVQAGRTVGIVGESGSGKSVLLRSVLGLIDPPGVVERGDVVFEGVSLTRSSEAALRRIRGRDISTVFQNPAGALNPVVKVGDQFVEAVRLHERVSRPAAYERALALVTDVGFDDAAALMATRPYELSSGVVQRILIAMALVHGPKLILADEPTTNLDVTVEAQILDAIARIQVEYSTTVIIVSHDMGVVSQVSDEIVVMYAGRIVEHGETADVLTRPAHPYTRALIESVPTGRITAGTRLPTIPGTPPDLSRLGPGCAFAERCAFATDRCVTQTPPLVPGTHTLRACHNPLEAVAP